MHAECVAIDQVVLDVVHGLEEAFMHRHSPVTRPYWMSMYQHIPLPDITTAVRTQYRHRNKIPEETRIGRSNVDTSLRAISMDQYTSGYGHMYYTRGPHRLFVVAPMVQLFVPLTVDMKRMLLQQNIIDTIPMDKIARAVNSLVKSLDASPSAIRMKTQTKKWLTDQGLPKDNVSQTNGAIVMVVFHMCMTAMMGMLHPTYRWVKDERVFQRMLNPKRERHVRVSDDNQDSDDEQETGEKHSLWRR